MFTCDVFDMALNIASKPVFDSKRLALVFRGLGRHNASNSTKRAGSNGLEGVEAEVVNFPIGQNSDAKG